MFKPTAIAIPLLTLFLAACGGSGGGDSVVSQTGNDTEETSPNAVTNGTIDQDSFELVADIRNPASYNFSGVTVDLTAFAGDQFQNPVPDGTTIFFSAESGLVPPSCTTTNGSCSVQWVSTGYRPGQEGQDEYIDLERVNERDSIGNRSVFGLTTILAYAEGEPGFTDSNNNGLYDPGEPFQAFGEAVRDDDLLNFDEDELDSNENGPVEFFADYDRDGVYDPAPEFYQGSACSEAARALGHCGSRMHVRSSVVIAQATQDLIHVSFYRAQTVGGIKTFTELTDGFSLGDSGTFYVYIGDNNLSKSASGTTLSAAAEGYEIFGDNGAVRNNVGILPDSYRGLPSSFGDVYAISYDPEVGQAQENITVTITSGDFTRTQKYFR